MAELPSQDSVTAADVETVYRLRVLSKDDPEILSSIVTFEHPYEHPDTTLVSIERFDLETGDVKAIHWSSFEGLSITDEYIDSIRRFL